MTITELLASPAPCPTCRAPTTWERHADERGEWWTGRCSRASCGHDWQDETEVRTVGVVIGPALCEAVERLTGAFMVSAEGHPRAGRRPAPLARVETAVTTYPTLTIRGARTQADAEAALRVAIEFVRDFQDRKARDFVGYLRGDLACAVYWTQARRVVVEIQP